MGAYHRCFRVCVLRIRIHSVSRHRAEDFIRHVSIGKVIHSSTECQYFCIQREVNEGKMDENQAFYSTGA